MLNVSHLNKNFSKIEALADVSFTANDGCITGLLGPNGAGKSTTLRILYAVLHPDSGHAYVDDYDSVKQAREVRKRIGVLPHLSGLYQRLTARENIAYYGRLYGLKKAELNHRLSELIELLDIGDFANRPAKSFSQGQAIKVALARALVHKPSNILLDEPTNGLDVATTRALRSYIKRLRDEGCCVLFSSHVMQEVSALCDDIVIINRGKVVMQGSPQQLKQQTGCENLEDAFIRITEPLSETAA